MLKAAKAADKPVSIISSNNPDTQNFYKSLNIDCACEEEGRPGGSTVRFMKFSTLMHPKQPNEKREPYESDKKPKLYYVVDESNNVKRIRFDTCMTFDEFEDLKEKLLDSDSNEVVDELGRYKQLMKPKPNENEPVVVDLSEVLKNQNLGISPKDAEAASTKTCK